MAYYERRANKLASDTITEEAELEIVPEPEPVHSEEGNVIHKASNELKVTVGAIIQNENRKYTRCKKKRKSKYHKSAATTSEFSSSNEPSVILGGLIMEKLALKLLLNSEPISDMTEPGKRLCDLPPYINCGESKKQDRPT